MSVVFLVSGKDVPAKLLLLDVSTKSVFLRTRLGSSSDFGFTAPVSTTSLVLSVPLFLPFFFVPSSSFSTSFSSFLSSSFLSFSSSFFSLASSFFFFPLSFFFSFRSFFFLSVCLPACTFCICLVACIGVCVLSNVPVSLLLVLTGLALLVDVSSVSCSLFSTSRI